MPFAASQVTVAVTDTTVLTGGDPVGAEVAVGRGQVLVRNTDAAKTVYLGGVGVTVAAGFPLKPDEIFTADAIGTSDTIHAIVASGTAVVAVLYEE